ncbi:hypothetical protein P879_09393 [Paragonimus westermani]|uniref:Ubiquinone biosynthesis O-methyltransferase, mitochondrial n=1 Tax=Paragonimus westermani TaxID=34504 RepID=A0A8T0DB44_9TREM|nr:hypothetical protein P879_09393 [Paragonimus westermani]
MLLSTYVYDTVLSFFQPSILRRGLAIFGRVRHAYVNYHHVTSKRSWKNHQCFHSSQLYPASVDNSHPEFTIEPDEARKFQKFSAYWWDPNGDLHALHSMNRLRVPFIRDGLLSSCSNEAIQMASIPAQRSYSPLTGFRIMDVGCGGGILSEPLAAIGADVLGIDQVAESIDVAQQHVKQAAYRWSEPGSKPPCYRLVSLESLASESPARFDAVVMSEVLEHVTDWEGMIQQASLCLKPNGMLFITTLNRTRASFLFAILCAEYLTRTVPRGTHKWAKFIEPTRLQAAAVKYGLCPRQLLGMRYNPLTGCWSWSNSLAVNYAFSAVKGDRI